MCPRDPQPPDPGDGAVGGENGGKPLATDADECAEEGTSDDGDVRLVATPEMCHYCFDMLVRALHPSAAPAEHTEGNSRLERYVPPAVDVPLFVTWDKRQTSFRGGDDFDLRGCIGTLSPRPLQRALGEFALTSALRDRRFDPIRRNELQSLRVGVSLLVEYEECRGFDDWVVGVHGIIILFDVEGGDDLQQARSSKQYSATYLPEVASDQGWTHEEAIISLVRKAGYRGAIHDEFLCTIRCTRYQSSKHRLTYQDYVASKCGGVDPLIEISSNRAADSIINMTADEVQAEAARGRARRNGNGTPGINQLFDMIHFVIDSATGRR